MGKSRGVFLISIVGTDIYKIGLFTGDPNKRLRFLQKGNPSKLKICRSWVVPSEDVFKVKSNFKRTFKKENMRSDWYTLTEGDICAFSRIMDPEDQSL